MRSLAGSVRGDGRFHAVGHALPVSGVVGQSADGSGTRVHLNIDPGARALSADLDGVLSFEARAPRFEGAVTLAAPRQAQKRQRRCAANAVADIGQGSRPIRPPRSSSSSRPATAPRRRALKFAGAGGHSLRSLAAAACRALRAAARCRQVRRQGQQRHRADPLVAGAARADGRDPAGADSGADRVQLPSRSCWAGARCRILPPICMPTPNPGPIDRLDFRAPGATRVNLSGTSAPGRPAEQLQGALSVDSSDPDTLVAWLQGRSEVTYRSQKPLRLRGDVSVASDRVAIDAMKAEIDGGAVEGRLASRHQRRRRLRGSTPS